MANHRFFKWASRYSVSSRGLVGGRDYMHSWLLPLVPHSASEISSIPFWTSCCEKQKTTEDWHPLCIYQLHLNPFAKIVCILETTPPDSSCERFSFFASFFSGLFSLASLKIEEWLKFFNSNNFVQEILANQLNRFFSRMLVLHKLVWVYMKIGYLLLFIWMYF